MILVCDVGNTNIVFGMFENDKCITTFRLVSSKLMTFDEYIAKIWNMPETDLYKLRKQKTYRNSRRFRILFFS